MSIASILFGIIIFSLLVLVHEAGHFLLAKLNHVTVTEFSLGMGPRLLSFERGGTRYSLKALPLGGSCAMLGEDMEDLGAGSFGAASVWSRIAIVAAGPVFNFLLAWLFSVILLMNVGVDKAYILDVTEHFPAQAAGLQAGDLITSVDGHRVYFYREISDFVRNHQDRMASGKPIRITWEREGARYEASLVPEKDESGQYKLGVIGSGQYRQRIGLWSALGYGAAEVRYWIGAVFEGLRVMFTGRVTLNDMAGPVGIVGIIDDTYQQVRTDGAYYVFLNLMNIAILLSANLGVMNLLPIPALDGGRLLFLLAEAIRRRRLDPAIEGKIHLAGLAVLLTLMLVILGNDIHRLFTR